MSLEHLVPMQKVYNVWMSATLNLVMLRRAADLERHVSGRAGKATLIWMRARRSLSGPKGHLP